MKEPTKLKEYIQKKKIRMIDIYNKTLTPEGKKAIDYKTLYNIVNGYTDPLLRSMKIIAEALNVDISTIF